MNSSSHSQPVLAETAIGNSEPSAAFTPGPWFVEKSTADFYYVTTDPGTCGPAIAQTWAAGEHVAHQEANVRLIAAAPDLLEATQDLLGIIASVCPEYVEATMCANARAAISKALGQ